MPSNSLLLLFSQNVFAEITSVCLFFCVSVHNAVADATGSFMKGDILKGHTRRVVLSKVLELKIKI